MLNHWTPPNYLLILLFGSSIILPALSQQPCLEAYDREALYLRTELFAGTVYVKNGISRPVGFAYRKLLPEFEQSPKSLPLFKKAQRFSKAQFWISTAGLACTATGAVMILQSVDRDGYLTNEKRYKNGLNLMMGSLVLSTAITLPLQIKSRQQLEDAVYWRNREALE
jgi:hypothetical protein